MSTDTYEFDNAVRAANLLGARRILAESQQMNANLHIQLQEERLVFQRTLATKDATIAELTERDSRNIDIWTEFRHKFEAIGINACGGLESQIDRAIKALATKELEVTKLREALEYIHDNSAAYQTALRDFIEEALSTPITTEALDAYVAEKIERARSLQEPIACVDLDQLENMQRTDEYADLKPADFKMPTDILLYRIPTTTRTAYGDKS